MRSKVPFFSIIFTILAVFTLFFIFYLQPHQTDKELTHELTSRFGSDLEKTYDRDENGNSIIHVIDSKGESYLVEYTPWSLRERVNLARVTKVEG